MRPRAFTLLEVVVALAILGLSLMAIFDISSQAVIAHVYAKRLTVATILARSKMVDLEQELIDKGFNADDDEEAGDFSDEGWPTFKWRAKILAPRTQGLSPEQLLSAVFNLPIDAQGGADAMGAFGALFGGGKPKPGSPQASAAGPKTDSPLLAAMGPAAGIAQGQFQQMVDTITKSVREVHLTVSWKDGKQTENIDVVTHVVSLGPGSDRNGAAPGGSGAPGSTPTGGGPAGAWVRPDTCAPVASPAPGPNGVGFVDPSDSTLLVPAASCIPRGGVPGPGGPGGKPQ